MNPVAAWAKRYAKAAKPEWEEPESFHFAAGVNIERATKNLVVTCAASM
jgi:hypothetical protein